MNDIPKTSKSTMPEASAESMALYKVMSALEEGAILSYEQLSKIVGGENVQKAKRHWLEAAVRRCLADGIVIGCVREVGIKRLENNQIDSVADATQKYVRNRARKTKKALASVEYERLTPDEKRGHCARLAFVGALALFAKGSSIKKLEANPDVADDNKVDINRTLELFKS